MVQEVLAFASAGGREIVLDMTLGLGGHAEAMLRDLPEIRHYIGMDVDPTALGRARERITPLAKKGQTLSLSHRSYVELEAALDEAGVEQVDVALVDLGASTYQLTDPGRGFSLTREGPLDMRMNPGQGPTALELIRRLDANELRNLLAEGEVDVPGRVARAIKKYQDEIRTTTQLADVVRRATPVEAGKTSYTHPATVVFQALRIAVNRELENIARALPLLIPRLKPGARVMAISFHSLEDRTVKQFMAQEVKGCTCPPDFPKCTCGKTPTLELLARRPLVPGEAELARNPASRSAKMRVARKL